MNSTAVKNIALFIDIENFCGFASGLGLSIDVKPEIDRLTEIGKVTIRKSFGDIHKLSEKLALDDKTIRRMLQSNLVQHEDVMYQNSYKNAADIRLVIDAVSTAYSNSTIDILAVIGADRDYLPLFSKIREMGKEVVGIAGNRGNTPELLVKACDMFFYHEVLCRPKIVDVETPEDTSSGVTSSVAIEHIPDEAITLLVNAMQALQSKMITSTFSAGDVLQMMCRLSPDFDLEAYGFMNFQSLCEKAAQELLIEMEFVDGAWHNLRLPSAKKVTCSATDIVEPKALDKPDSGALRRWLEGKLTGNRWETVKLPHYSERISLYQKMSSVLRKCDDGGMTLEELANSVTLELPYSETLTQSSIFKVLLTLYYAQVFSCSPGFTPTNPIIIGLRDYTDTDFEKYDKRLIENYIRQYNRETKNTVDAESWSELYYGDKSKAEKINDVLKFV